MYGFWKAGLIGLQAFAYCAYVSSLLKKCPQPNLLKVRLILLQSVLSDSLAEFFNSCEKRSFASLTKTFHKEIRIKLSCKVIILNIAKAYLNIWFLIFGSKS